MGRDRPQPTGELRLGHRVTGSKCRALHAVGSKIRGTRTRYLVPDSNVFSHDSPPGCTARSAARLPWPAPARAGLLSQLRGGGATGSGPVSGPRGQTPGHPGRPRFRPSLRPPYPGSGPQADPVACADRGSHPGQHPEPVLLLDAGAGISPQAVLTLLSSCPFLSSPTGGCYTASSTLPGPLNPRCVRADDVPVAACGPGAPAPGAPGDVSRGPGRAGEGTTNPCRNQSLTWRR